MTKQEQFLWVVQTTLLGHQTEGITPLMLEAIRASERIPQDKKLEEATVDFCEWALRRDDNSAMPAWMRGGI